VINIFVNQLCKRRIINKIKFIVNKIQNGKVTYRNTPFIISRWPLLEPKLKYLYRFKIHPYYFFP